jgi:hypothetical protein
MQPIDLAHVLRTRPDVQLVCPQCGHLTSCAWYLYRVRRSRRFPACAVCYVAAHLYIRLRRVRKTGGAT